MTSSSYTILPQYHQNTRQWVSIGHSREIFHFLLLSCLVHCGSTRQTASILTIDREHLRTGDKASCRFRFIKGPEFLHVGTRMVFRERRTKAVGSITKIYPHRPGQPTGVSSAVKHHKISHYHSTGGGGRSKGRRGRGGRGRYHYQQQQPQVGVAVGGALVDSPTRTHGH